MDMRYLEYCLAGPLFYDVVPKQVGGFAQTHLPAPQGWRRAVEAPWIQLAPEGLRLPPQGWKIHVSSCVEDADDVLGIVWDYCVAQRVAFKFLPSRSALIGRNLKHVDRGGSGKFITLYPRDDVELERVLEGLAPLLQGRRGPYILSDLRYGAGPLYVRYGGFAERRCRDEHGDLVLAIEDGSGTLVPDPRQPVFQPPSWVELPQCLVDHRRALGGDEPPADFPYVIEKALHFSNSGGIYLARDRRSGAQVVLKEARPYAGLDSRGVDAVARLERELELLTELADLTQVVSVHERFSLWEHQFLVQEYIEGETLNKVMVERFPLVHASEASNADYTAWALDVVAQVEVGLSLLHERGVTFGDLHPKNLMVRPDGRVTFIDFEMSYRAGEPPNVGVGAPGYIPPDGRSGPDADRYSLAALKLSMFLPLTVLLPLDSAKAGMLADSVAERFPVPRSYLDGALKDLGLPTRERCELVSGWDRGRPDWPEIQRQIVAGIVASATPERSDRLFPGDIQQFLGSGTGLAHGAAGVLYALSVTGHGRFPRFEEWLLAHAGSGNPGLYDGAHGTAHVLDHLGYRAEALELVERTLRIPLELLSNDLYSGLAGVGLNLLHLSRRLGEPGLRDQALVAGKVLADRLLEGGSPVTTGLMRGSSGPALFFLHLFEETRDVVFLDLAEHALTRDLQHCLPAPDGSLQVNEGWRIMPHLASGSAGIGVVLHRLLIHRPDEGLAEQLTLIQRAAEPEFVISSTLFNGRAGLIALLTETGGDEAHLRRHLHRLAWHAIGYSGHLAFPGEQLLRLSMDLASGGAGVLLAINAALGHGPTLPFLRASSRNHQRVS